MKNKTKALPIKIILLVALFIAGCSAESPVINQTNAEQVLPVTQIISKETVLHHEYVAEGKSALDKP